MYRTVGERGEGTHSAGRPTQTIAIIGNESTIATSDTEQVTPYPNVVGYTDRTSPMKMEARSSGFGHRQHRCGLRGRPIRARPTSTHEGWRLRGDVKAVDTWLASRRPRAKGSGMDDHPDGLEPVDLPIWSQRHVGNVFEEHLSFRDGLWGALVSDTSGRDALALKDKLDIRGQRTRTATRASHGRLRGISCSNGRLEGSEGEHPLRAHPSCVRVAKWKWCTLKGCHRGRTPGRRGKRQRPH